MRNADAEAERPHGVDVVDLGGKLRDHQARPDVVGREQIRETIDVVPAAAAPGDLPEIEPVVNTVVNERGQPVLVDGVPEAQLGSDPVIEP
jgi:hypothetical protein